MAVLTASSEIVKMQELEASIWNRRGGQFLQKF